MKLLNIGLACLICLASWTTAWAQQVEDYIRVQPRPDWTVTVEVPDVDHQDHAGRKLVYPLTDYQNRHGLTSDEYSSRYVVDLLTPAAVEDEGTISLDFDPAYQTLSLHHVRLIRDGHVIDGIDLSEAMLFRTETNRDQMIFNGTLTFMMPILDLRVGDRLDVSYTWSGRNPAIGRGYFRRRSFASTTEVKRSFRRSLIQDGLALHTKTFNDPPEPKRIEADGWTILEWDRPDPEAPDYDDELPPWAYVRPTFELSNFENWSDVGNLFAPYYERTDADRAAVRAIADEIAAQHEDSKPRARAALDWVQQNVRYVGIEFGTGGYIPRPPQRVLRRRFGDCKDVTLLLLTLLDELGIQADPILVDMDERGQEFLGLPNPYAFDHIIVVAEIGDSLYPLDATRDPQLGTLDTMDKSEFEFGLRLKPDASVVTRLPRSDYDAREYIKETFDLVSEPGTILYELSFREYGSDADATARWVERAGQQSVQDDFVAYLADIYPTLEPVGDMEWELNDKEAWSELRMNFRMPGYTADGERTLDTRAYQILAAMPDFEGGERDAPFKIDHPRNVHHIRDYVVDERYSFNPSMKTVENDAFRFVYKESYEDNIFREDHHWITKRDHIAAEDFVEDMSSVSTIRGWNFITINLAFDEAEGEDEPDYGWPVRALAWLVMILFPVGFVWLIFRSRRAGRAAS